MANERLNKGAVINRHLAGQMERSDIYQRLLQPPGRSRRRSLSSVVGGYGTVSIT